MLPPPSTTSSITGNNSSYTTLKLLTDLITGIMLASPNNNIACYKNRTLNVSTVFLSQFSISNMFP